MKSKVPEAIEPQSKVALSIPSSFFQESSDCRSSKEAMSQPSGKARSLGIILKFLFFLSLGGVGLGGSGLGSTGLGGTGSTG